MTANPPQQQCEYFDTAKKTDAALFDVRTADHPADLYQFNGIHSINYNSAPTLAAAATAHHTEQFEQQGYLVIEEFLTASETAKITQALQDTIKNKDFQLAAAATSFKQTSGEVNLAKGGANEVLQFESFVHAIPEAERYDIRNVRKLQGFHSYHPDISALSSNPVILSLVSGLLKKEGVSEAELSDGLEIFQSLALVKPPGGREKPWHQDHAFFDIHTSTKMVGIWIALSQTTPLNGCMHLMPSYHKKKLHLVKRSDVEADADADADADAIPHHKIRDFQICDSLFQGQECVAVPLRPGGALIFSTMLPHGTPTNKCNTQRIAVQFHFAARGAPRCDVKERLDVCGGGGGVQSADIN